MEPSNTVKITFSQSDNMTSEKTMERPDTQSLSFKKRKNYYAILLEMLIRKTESEKRKEIFGTDPLF